MTHDRETRAGVAYGLAAYTAWGFIALYFKAVAHVAPLEVLAHRIVWSLVLLLILLGVRRRLGLVIGALRVGRTAAALGATTVLIALNWYVFIWAVANGHVLQASLGYFINPLVNVMLGRLFLGERLRRAQAFSVLLALAGVAWLTWQLGRVPVISLTLAFSFGFYGLLRKRVDADATTGLAAETLLLTPVALIYLLRMEGAGTLAFTHVDPRTDLLLPLGGVVTAVPLIWFANAARRLRYSTVGFLQYIAPSLQFLLAVAAFGEPFSRDHMIAFAFIWTALAVFTRDAFLASRPVSRK